MSNDNQDRVHAATVTRLDQARRDGLVAKSQELSAAIQLLLAVLAAYFLAQGFLAQLTNLTVEIWSESAKTAFTADDFQFQIQRLGIALFWLLAPFLVLVFVFSVLSNMVQTGPIINARPVVPDPSRLLPSQRLRRLFSLPTMSRAVFGIPKVALAVSVAIAALWLQREHVFGLADVQVNEMVSQLTSILFHVAFWIAGALLVTSMLDYWIERVAYRQRLRMTNQELQDEQRMQNVDARLTQKRRQFHGELAIRPQRPV